MDMGAKLGQATSLEITSNFLRKKKLILSILKLYYFCCEECREKTGMKFVIEFEIKKSIRTCYFVFLIIIDVPCSPKTKLIALTIALWIQIFYSECL
jgi:hypothetical protein